MNRKKRTSIIAGSVACSSSSALPARARATGANEERDCRARGTPGAVALWAVGLFDGETLRATAAWYGAVRESEHDIPFGYGGYISELGEVRSAHDPHRIESEV